MPLMTAFLLLVASELGLHRNPHTQHAKCLLHGSSCHHQCHRRQHSTHTKSRASPYFVTVLANDEAFSLAYTVRLFIFDPSCASHAHTTRNMHCAGHHFKISTVPGVLWWGEGRFLVARSRWFRFAMRCCLHWCIVWHTSCPRLHGLACLCMSSRCMSRPARPSAASSSRHHCLTPTGCLISVPRSPSDSHLVEC